jgi:urease accessory protein
MEDLLLMLLADARLPTAGHTQSAGLEPAVVAGLGAGQVPQYMALRLATVTRVEAATAVVALHAIGRGESLSAVAAAWSARTPSAAMRATGRHLGTALARLTRRLWPDSAVVSGMPRAVVLAAAAQAAGVSPAGLARLVGYDDVQTVGSAALKLLPLDPADVAAWVLAQLPGIEALAAEVASLRDPGDIPVLGAPQIEAWAEAHAIARRRLFSA